MSYTKINLLETINLIMSGRLTINTIVLEKYYPTFNLIFEFGNTKNQV